MSPSPVEFDKFRMMRLEEYNRFAVQMNAASFVCRFDSQLSKKWARRAQNYIAMAEHEQTVHEWYINGTF